MAVRPLPNVEAFHRPRTIEEALDLLQDPSARPLGGGTSLALTRHPGVKALVSLRGLGLDYLKAEGGAVRIGAAARIQRLARAAEIDAVASGVVRRAAQNYLARPHRNAATLGGVLASAYSWADLAVAILAAGGDVRIVDRAGARDVPVDDFFHPSPAKAIGKGIIESVRLPLSKAGGGLGGYQRAAKTETDVSIAAAVVRLDLDGGKVRSARIGLTGLAVSPGRATGAEKVLAGQPLSGDAASEAAERTFAEGGLEPLGDIRGSAAYRRSILPVLVRRAILEGLEGGSR